MIFWTLFIDFRLDGMSKNIGYFIGMSFKDNLKKHHLKLLKMMDGRAGWILEKKSAADEYIC